MTFRDLGLIKEILAAVEEKGYTTPTPIQEQVIPLILNKQDLMAGAQTGTGKTAGFTLPILQLLMASPPSKEGKRPVRALILAPTRELAAQIAESVRAYGKYLPLRSTMICGGMSNQAQTRDLRRGVDIVIATPGRLLDHISQKNLQLSQIELFVLDEADRMLDMGFVPDIKKIIALMPKQQQSLMFSATFSEEVKALAASFLKSHETVTIARQNAVAELVSQTAYSVDQKRKQELLSFLISSKKWKQVLVFTRTKHGANKLADQLEEDGISTTVIHGNKSQGARSKALYDFKQGKVCALVATDVAARGIDISSLSHVVNFEVPNAAEDYIHRIGRTGRAGNSGEAISFVCIDEVGLFNSVERLLQKKIPLMVEPGYEPDPTIKAKPISRGRRNGGGGSFGRSGPRSGGGGRVRRSGDRFGPRSESNGDGSHSDNSRRNSNRSEFRSEGDRGETFGDNNRKDGGFSKPRPEGSSDVPRGNSQRRSGGFGPRREGGFGKPRSGNNRKPGGNFGPRREGGDSRPPREGAKRGPRPEGFGDSPRGNHAGRSGKERSNFRSEGNRGDAGGNRKSGNRFGARSEGNRGDSRRKFSKKP